MAFSSNGTKCVGPNFDDYLNGLREEFELLSNPTSTNSSRPSRFNLYLGALKGEVELMSLEIESLRKEKYEYGLKGSYFSFMYYHKTEYD
jgi:hypothetical protein